MFRETKFLFEHMKQTVHGIVLAGCGTNDQSIAFQVHDLATSNGHFKSSGLDPVSRHFNHDPIKFRPVSSPLVFGWSQNVPGQRLKAGTGCRYTEHHRADPSSLHSYDRSEERRVGKEWRYWRAQEH